MAICLCCVMLIGTTFAWFTDTATSGVNKIQSGNLDLNVEYTLNGTDWQALTKDTQLFEGGLFEPGYTRVVAFRVKNAGNLALKYAVNMNLVSETNGTNVYDMPFKLSDYLTVNTIADATAGQLTTAFANRTDDTLDWTTTDFNAALESLNIKDVVLKADETGKTGKVLLMQVTMPTDVGNEANAKDANSQPEINFGVAFVATQAVEESDSYGNTYDEKAAYPVIDAADLKETLKNGGNIAVNEMIAISGEDTDAACNVIAAPTTLTLSAPIIGPADMGNNNTNFCALIVDADTTINGGPQGGIVFENENGGYAINVRNGANLVINGGTYGAGGTAVQVKKGTVTINGGHFEADPFGEPYGYGFVLNCIDSAYKNGTAKIVVKGGTFVNFDPSNCTAEGAGTNFVASGYKVVSETHNDDIWYTVVAE